MDSSYAATVAEQFVDICVRVPQAWWRDQLFAWFGLLVNCGWFMVHLGVQ